MISFLQSFQFMSCKKKKIRLELGVISHADVGGKVFEFFAPVSGKFSDYLSAEV